MIDRNDLTAAERRKKRQRERVIEEAVRLYNERGGENGGFETTTVEDIAERADISVRTFFRYFESKHDVIYLDYRKAIEDLLLFVEARLETETPEIAAYHGSMDQLEAFVANPINRQRIAHALQSPNFTERRAVWQLHSRRALSRILLPHLEHHEDPGLEADSISALIRSVVDEGLTAWSLNPDREPSAYIKRALELTSQLAIRIATQNSQ